MKNIIYTLLAIILTANVLNGQGISISSEDLFAKANLSYEKKRYSDAQILYQQLVDGGYSSKELFYNLANTYFKMKKYGYAVFYYEKAIRLDPSDEDIAFNLELTQLYLKDKIITPPDFFIYDISKKIMRSLSINTWAIMSLLGWYVFVGLNLLGKIRGTYRRFFRTLITTIGIYLLFCTINFGAGIYARAKTQEAIILNAVADVKSEPDKAGSIVFVLHEGTKVQIRSEKADWFEIKLRDGKVGWLRKDDLGIL
ncbi:tetratricopeptide repeat protein [bacterium]|nr:tetratricopeptide repeat protein [bacterium]